MASRTTNRLNGGKILLLVLQPPFSCYSVGGRPGGFELASQNTTRTFKDLAGLKRRKLKTNTELQKKDQNFTIPRIPKLVHFRNFRNLHSSIAHDTYPTNSKNSEIYSISEFSDFGGPLQQSTCNRGQADRPEKPAQVENKGSGDKPCGPAHTTYVGTLTAAGEGEQQPT